MRSADAVAGTIGRAADHRPAARLGVRVVPAVALCALVLRRWWQIGPFPSGLDGGNWLAFGRRLFRDGGKATDGAYPPLIPAVAYLGQRLIDPLLATKLLAVGSLAAVVVATYVAARAGTNRWFALSAAVVVGASDAVAETVAFGGYPQNYACALTVVAACALARYLAGGARRDAAAAAAALAGVALCHHLAFALSCCVAAGVWLLWATTGPPRAAAVRRTTGGALAALCGVAGSLPTFVAMRRAGYAPTANIAHFTLWQSLRYATQDAPLFWFAVILGGIACSIATWRQRRAAPWQVHTALLGVSLVAFAATGEARVVPFVLIGATLAVCFAAHGLWCGARGTKTRVASAVLVAALPLVLWVPADRAAAVSIAQYRVVDGPLMGVAAYLARHPTDGAVVVRADYRGWPIGWWLEGLTGSRLIVGSDARYLSFPGERDASRVASLFFAPGTTADATARLGGRYGVRALVIKKRDWIGWRGWLAAGDPRVAAAYDDGEYLVVAIAP